MASEAKYYHIVSESAGKVLDLCQEGQNKGQLVIYDKWQGDNQQFAVHTRGMEALIMNKKSKAYLTVANDSDKNGATVVQAPINNQPSQRFRLQEIKPDSGLYVIFTFCGKALDICEGSSKNNSKVIQWDFHAEDNQKWMLKPVEVK